MMVYDGTIFIIISITDGVLNYSLKTLSRCYVVDFTLLLLLSDKHYLHIHYALTILSNIIICESCIYNTSYVCKDIV